MDNKALITLRRMAWERAKGKFKKGNDSHWISFGVSNAVMRHPSFERLKDWYPKLDGIGHTVVFRSTTDIQAIENTHSNACDKTMCSICGRSNFCFERKLSK